MEGIFYYNSNLRIIDVSNFHTPNIIKLNSMFEGCSSLKSLNLSQFNTIKVEEMDYMFLGCHALKYLDISSFRYNISYNYKTYRNILSSDSSLNITIHKSFFDLIKNVIPINCSIKIID